MNNSSSSSNETELLSAITKSIKPIPWSHSETLAVAQVQHRGKYPLQKYAVDLGNEFFWEKQFRHACTKNTTNSYPAAQMPDQWFLTENQTLCLLSLPFLFWGSKTRLVFSCRISLHASPKSPIFTWWSEPCRKIFLGYRKREGIVHFR